MKKPKRCARCAACGGIRRPADDLDDAERESPLCWLCRLRRDARQNGKA